MTKASQQMPGSVPIFILPEAKHTLWRYQNTHGSPLLIPRKSSGKKKKFESNNKYFSICTYVVATFTICLIIFKFINNWRDMQIYTSSILSTLSPFLIAFLIAYFINPLVNRIDHILFSRTASQKFAKLHKFLSLLLAYVIVIGFIALC